MERRRDLGTLHPPPLRPVPGQGAPRRRDVLRDGPHARARLVRCDDRRDVMDKPTKLYRVELTMSAVADRYYHPGSLPDSQCMGCREGTPIDGDRHVDDGADGYE